MITKSAGGLVNKCITVAVAHAKGKSQLKNCRFYRSLKRASWEQKRGATSQQKERCGDIPGKKKVWVLGKIRQQNIILYKQAGTPTKYFTDFS